MIEDSRRRRIARPPRSQPMKKCKIGVRTGCEILSSGSGGLGVQKVNLRPTAGYALNPRTRLTTAAPNTHRAIVRSATLASLLRGCQPGLRINEHLPYPGDMVFRHACKMGLEGSCRSG